MSPYAAFIHSSHSSIQLLVTSSTHHLSFHLHTPYPIIHAFLHLPTHPSIHLSISQIIHVSAHLSTHYASTHSLTQSSNLSKRLRVAFETQRRVTLSSSQRRKEEKLNLFQLENRKAYSDYFQRSNHFLFLHI